MCAHPQNASLQRLTDAEIGDAAAICCRFVVLVIDAYMQMCANLHKHDETEVSRAGGRARQGRVLRLSALSWEAISVLGWAGLAHTQVPTILSVWYRYKHCLFGLQFARRHGTPAPGEHRPIT